MLKNILLIFVYFFCNKIKKIIMLFNKIIYKYVKLQKRDNWYCKLYYKKNKKIWVEKYFCVEFFYNVILLGGN